MQAAAVEAPCRHLSSAGGDDACGGSTYNVDLQKSACYAWLGPCLSVCVCVTWVLSTSQKP
jgi:hypothetical protein